MSFPGLFSKLNKLREPHSVDYCQRLQQPVNERHAGSASLVLPLSAHTHTHTHTQLPLGLTEPCK